MDRIGNSLFLTTGSENRLKRLLRWGAVWDQASSRLAHQLDAKVDIVSSPKGRSVAITHVTFTSPLVQPVNAVRHLGALA
jgi:hypothetical protein